MRFYSSNSLWKHERFPVWQAGFNELTRYNKASESQSTSIFSTGWTLPDSSPFIHNLLWEVLQKWAFPDSTVLCKAILFAYASIKISLVFISCTITGIIPFRFSKSILSIDFSTVKFDETKRYKNFITMIWDPTMIQWQPNLYKQFNREFIHLDSLIGLNKI